MMYAMLIVNNPIINDDLSSITTRIKAHESLRLTNEVLENF